MKKMLFLLMFGFVVCTSPAFAGKARVVTDEEIAQQMLERITNQAPNMSEREKRAMLQAFEEQVSGMTSEQKLQAYAKAKEAIDKYKDDKEYDAYKQLKMEEKLKGDEIPEKLEEVKEKTKEKIKDVMPQEPVPTINSQEYEPVVEQESPSEDLVQNPVDSGVPSATNYGAQQQPQTAIQQYNKFLEQNKNVMSAEEKANMDMWKKQLEEQEKLHKEYMDYINGQPQ